MLNFNELRDPDLIEKIKEVSTTITSKKSLVEVLKNLDVRSGWSHEDEEFLAKTSSEEFYEVFKNEDGPQLPRWIFNCLEFGKARNASENALKITQTVTEALIRIGEESKLNRRRVDTFGIKMPNDKES